MKCWGKNNWGQVILLATFENSVISVCGIIEHELTICFFMQLGDDTAIDRKTPVQVVGLGSGVLTLASGEV